MTQVQRMANVTNWILQGRNSHL